MSETRTTAILQRVPVILAVTASSYGLEWQVGGMRRLEGRGARRRDARNTASGSDKPAARR